jgi:hypothetical protein
MSTTVWTGKWASALVLGAAGLLFAGLGQAATEKDEATQVAANDLRTVQAPAPVYASVPPPAVPVDYVILGIIGGAAILAGSADGGTNDTTTTTTTTP